VLLFEDVGAIEAFKRSSALVKRTWGEQVTFNFGLGLLGFVAIIPGLLVGGLLAATGFVPLVVLGVVGIVAWVVLVATVTSAMSAVFKAALYRWANGLPVDPAFDADELTSAFRRK
jgi:O-antigen ligase